MAALRKNAQDVREAPQYMEENDMSKPDESKAARIKREKLRLGKFYENIEPVKKGIAAGLIERAAFMRVECEDLEEDLLEHGWTELFQQSDKCDPYDRARPQGQAYQQLNANYQKIIKQLDGMLPTVESKPKSDGFDEFLEMKD
jgi:hypothetical protein